MMGFEVTWTSHGREFQLLYGNMKPDAVIIDLSIPDVTGVELCHWLAREEKPTLVVLMADLPPDALQLLTEKVLPPTLSVVSLVKPIRRGDLVAALQPLSK